MMFGFGKKDYFRPGPDGTEPVIAFVGKSLTVPVYSVPALLGRETGQVDVLINDATVSRKHLYIGTYESRITATDQGSTSGTMINGEELEPGVPYYLSEGDKVKIGKLSFVCHLNKNRTGKKLTIPDFIHRDDAGDTSEMEKADIAAAEAAEEAEAIPEDASDLDAAAAVFRNAEKDLGHAEKEDPVINLMPDPVLEEGEEPESEGPAADEEPQEAEPGEDADAEPEEPASDAEPEDEALLDELSKEEPSVPSVTIDVMKSGTGNGPKARFVYYSGQTAVESFDIAATPFVIGRAKSDYTPGAAGVSRRHCFIDRTGSTFYVTDLESTNGVWINGRRIKPYNRTALESGDIVGIGDRVYRFEII